MIAAQPQDPVESITQTDVVQVVVTNLAQNAKKVLVRDMFATTIQIIHVSMTIVADATAVGTGKMATWSTVSVRAESSLLHLPMMEMNALKLSAHGSSSIANAEKPSLIVAQLVATATATVKTILVI